MWSGLGAIAVVLLIAQTGSNGCGDDPAPSPAPTTPGQPTPSSGVFTTQDGVRFRVETFAANLDVPWSLVFAPDARLFVTERPGRVRIFNTSTRTSELALTLDDVSAQGEAGALGP